MIPDRIFIDEDLIAYHCLTDRYDGDLEYISKDLVDETIKSAEAQSLIVLQDYQELLEDMFGNINN